MKTWILAIALVAACGNSKDKAPTGGGKTGALARNFKKPGSWSFDYKQDMNVTDPSPKDADMPEAVSARGTIEVASNGDGTAKLKLDAEMTMSGHGTEKMPPLEFALDEAPPSKAANDQQALTMLLFPLPTKPLKAGESETQTFSMPVNVGSEHGVVSAPVTLTVTGVDTINGHPCTTIETKLRFDHKTADGTAKMHIDGKACVHATDGLVVKSSLKLDMGVTSTSAAGSDVGSMSMNMSGTLELARK